LMVNGLEEQVGRLRAEARGREEVLGAELAAERARGDGLQDRVEELSRRLGKDSSDSSRPPSSDGPYRKPRDRSLRKPSGRQPGAQSSTLRQHPDPGQTVECAPPACRGCGADLSAVPVLAVQKRQVFEAQPAPPPRVTQYLVQSRRCPCCGDVSQGTAPAGVS